MGAMQRTKGQAGEREAAAIIRDLTGWDAQRRVRQHDGDSDILGVPGWAVEVKRHATATPGLIASWWRQACAQAGGDVPVLMYRADRGHWRCVWPLSVLLTHQVASMWSGIEWTADTTPSAWAAVAREVASARKSL
jgi:hypothetical protein